MKSHINQSRGFSLLISVLVVSAFILLVSIGMSLRARNSMWAGFDIVKSKQVAMITRACNEYALNELAQTLHYAGNEGIIIDDGTCTVLPVLDMIDGSRVVQISASLDDYVARSELTVSPVSPSPVILSWKYVVDHE